MAENRDFDMDMNAITDPGELTVSLPKCVIAEINKEGIDYNSIFVTTIKDILRRKEIFNEIRDWEGKTVEILTISTNVLYGRIKEIKFNIDEPWNFSVRLQTGLCSWTQLESSVIDEINEIPVVINEYGTFHLVDQYGLISVFGEHWWKKGHIDVYLEYDPSVELEDQKTFEYLSEFIKKKYEIDESVRQIIVRQLVDREEIQVLFNEFDEADPKKRGAFILEELTNKMDLWFVNISLSGDLYMDYNYSNGIGSFSVGVTKMPNVPYMFKLSDITLLEDEE